MGQRLWGWKQQTENTPLFCLCGGDASRSSILTSTFSSLLFLALSQA